jgi:hypothetical protein
MDPDIDAVCKRIRDDGFCFVPSSAATTLLDVPLPDWEPFATRWNNMPLDTHMTDGGRYRRRRHATLSVAPFATTAEHSASWQPHVLPWNPHDRDHLRSLAQSGTPQNLSLVRRIVALAGRENRWVHFLAALGKSR